MKKGEILDRVYKSNLQSRAKQIMFYLINRANAEGTCFPSVKTIASDCGVSERTVQRTMKVLLEEGYILKENRYRDNGGQSSNLYMLQIEPEKADNKEEVGNNLEAQETKQPIEEAVMNDNNTTEEVEIVTFEDYKETVGSNDVEIEIINENSLPEAEKQAKINPLHFKMQKYHHVFAKHGERIRTIPSTLNNLQLQCHRVSDKLYSP